MTQYAQPQPSCRRQIPIEPAEPTTHSSRDFVPWRFSDARGRSTLPQRHTMASEKPAHKAVIGSALAFAVSSKLYFIAVTAKADIVRQAELDRQINALSTNRPFSQCKPYNRLQGFETSAPEGAAAVLWSDCVGEQAIRCESRTSIYYPLLPGNRWAPSHDADLHVPMIVASAVKSFVRGNSAQGLLRNRRGRI